MVQNHFTTVFGAQLSVHFKLHNEPSSGFEPYFVHGFFDNRDPVPSLLTYVSPEEQESKFHIKSNINNKSNEHSASFLSRQQQPVVSFQM